MIRPQDGRFFLIGKTHGFVVSISELGNVDSVQYVRGCSGIVCKNWLRFFYPLPKADG